MSVEHAPVPHSEPEVALIVALAVERTCFDFHFRRPGGALVSLQQCGPGAVNARRAAAAAIASGAKALVSWGMAGAIAQSARPGSIVLPRAVVRPGAGPIAAFGPWRARLASVLQSRFAINEGDLLAASEVLRTPADKSRAAAASRAVAVDMESGAIAEAAAEAGVPFVVIRVVADGTEDSLPAGIERWIDAAGRRRVAPVLGAVLHPECWRPLLTLAGRYREARRTLNRAARELAPRGFLFREPVTSEA